MALHRPRLTVVLDTDARPPHGIGRFLVLSSYWFALAYLWQPMAIFVLPILVGRVTTGATFHAGALELQLDRNTYLGLVTGAGTLVAVVWQPMAGAISDRTRWRLGRRRPYILAGAASSALVLASLAAVSSFWWLVLAYLALQVSSNTAQGPYQGMVPDDQRGQASAFYGAVQLMATLLGAVVIGIVLVPRGGLEWALLSMAAVVVVTGAVVAIGVPDVVTTRAPSVRLGRSLVLCFLIDTRRYSDFAWLLVSRLFFLTGLLGVQEFLLYYLQALFHLTDRQAAAEAGYVLVTGLLVSTVFSFAMGYLSERWGRRPIVAASCLLGAACCLAFVWVRSQAALIGLGAVLGIASGTFFSVDWAFATDLIPRDEAGRYMGLANVVTAGAGVLAGLVIGPTIGAVNRGRASTAGYAAMFLLATALFLLALGALSKVRESRESRTMRPSRSP